MLIAQISDTHLSLDSSDEDREQRIADFELVVSDINRLDIAPVVIVHTGDIVHHGRAEEYARAGEILAQAKAPVFVLPGNKDERKNLHAAFASGGYLAPDAAFIDYAVEDFPVRLIMLDTLNPGSNKGDFCEERAARFRGLVAAGDGRPVAVFAHHPPFEVPVGPDPMHYDDPQAMKRLREELEQVDGLTGVFCGHVHRFASGTVGATPVSVVTAVSTTLRKGDYPEEARSRPLYQLHRFEPGGTFMTQMRVAMTG